MTDKLPPNLLALFAPRPPLRFLPPTDKAAGDRRTPYISGLATFLPELQKYKETDKYEPTESHQQHQDRVKLEKQQKADFLADNAVKLFNPKEDPKIEGDPLKTLFVGRLSYEVTERDLEQEFSRFGPIEKVRIVRNDHAMDTTPEKKKQKKHQGYAFVVFERAKDMTAAYKVTDGLKIKGKTILVDVERGRTVVNWRPRRLGGGLGGRGYTKARPPGGPTGPTGFNGGPPSGPGGFRSGFQDRRGGGFRGDFRGRGGFGGGRGGGDFGGGRGGIGYQSNGFGGAPDGAPAGPRGGGVGGGAPAGGRPNGFGGSRPYDDRGSYGGGGSRGYSDRDRDGGTGGYGGRDDSRKRRFDDSGSYDDRRNKPRY